MYINEYLVKMNIWLKISNELLIKGFPKMVVVG